MGKLKELHGTEKIVFEVLLNNEATRNSDNLLFSEVYEKLLENDHIDIGAIDVKTFFHGLSNSGLPAIETISRARRKIQERFPWLKATDPVQRERDKNRKAFEKYALEQ